MSLQAQRDALLETALRMNASGINQGTSGNVSLRLGGDRMLITPSGLPYEASTPADMVVSTFTGRVVEGNRKPSSEWHFHGRLYQAREDAHAIVHTHSVHATALSCHGLGIPAFHYMVAAAGGRDIRCAPYATFGTEVLADHAVTALEGRKACLLANHGVIALGKDLDSALALAVEVETLAHQYIQARTLGEPVILDNAEMDRVIEKFKSYGAHAQSTPDVGPKQVPRVNLPNARKF